MYASQWLQLMRANRLTPLLLVGCALVPLISAEETPCTIHGNGKYYDLNPLKNVDYEMKTPGGLPLVLSVCDKLHSDVFGLKDAEDPSGFVRRGHGDFSIGRVNNTLSLTNSGPRLTLTEGSRCKTSSDEVIERIRASTVIDFICDMSVFGTGSPRLVAQLPPYDENVACAFYFEWKTHYACPTSESGSVWSFFTTLAILSLVLVMAYTVIGTLYNRYVLRLRGFDQIPQFSLESMRYHAHEAIDWFRDIMTILYENSQRPGGGSNDLPFRRPGGSANAPNPFSHFTQTNNDNEFIRPQASRTDSSRRHDINPVSHQSQAHSEIAAGPSLQSAVPLKDARNLNLGKDITEKAAPQEKQFMLDDDEDDDVEEDLGIVGSSPQPTPTVPQPGGS